MTASCRHGPGPRHSRACGGDSEQLGLSIMSRLQKGCGAREVTVRMQVTAGPAGGPEEGVLCWCWRGPCSGGQAERGRRSWRDGQIMEADGSEERGSLEELGLGWQQRGHRAWLPGQQGRWCRAVQAWMQPKPPESLKPRSNLIC